MKSVLIQHPSKFEHYMYRLGYRFDPGAMAEAFLPATALPLISFRGRARVAGSLRPLQPAQVWFNQQSGIVGLGGVQAGQLLGQPLIDLDNL